MVGEKKNGKYLQKEEKLSMGIHNFQPYDYPKAIM